jgi:hypothetical protein
MRRYFRLVIFLSLPVLLLTACAHKNSASQVVEDYLKAKVKSDADKLASLSCKDWEAQAQQDALPFQSVDAKLQDMSCTENGQEGSYTLVTCEGKIVVAYRGETRELNLSDTIYRAIKENGEWKMCGEE